ncbi:MAG: hypothetical protein OXC99_00065 [Chloroflexi bacterium]|nr:hypothetical protein [Chloroflexota bacterium]
MTTLKIPRWRTQPQQVWVNCQLIRDLGRDEEFVVHFIANGEHYISFVPKRFVNATARLLQGLIVADVEGGLLVDIPVETLTSGPRILVSEGERDSVLKFTGWDLTNGT